MSMLFLFKQKTAYEMRISDWSSDVCSSDLKRNFVDTGLCAELIALIEANRRPSTIADDNGDRYFRPSEIGRASCRERVCQSVLISVVAVPLKNIHTHDIDTDTKLDRYHYTVTVR